MIVKCKKIANCSITDAVKFVIVDEGDMDFMDIYEVIPEKGHKWCHVSEHAKMITTAKDLAERLIYDGLFPEGIYHPKNPRKISWINEETIKDGLSVMNILRKTHKEEVIKYKLQHRLDVFEDYLVRKALILCTQRLSEFTAIGKYYVGCTECVDDNCWNITGWEYKTLLDAGNVVFLDDSYHLEIGTNLYKIQEYASSVIAEFRHTLIKV